MEEQQIKAKIGECQLELEQLQARANQVVAMKRQLTEELYSQKAQVTKEKPKLVEKPKKE